MSKHTEGPWQYRPITGDICDRAGTLVMSLKNETAYDGVLVAAAPDLLEALEGILDDLDNVHRLMGSFDLSHAYAAIAKAKGESDE